MQQAKHQFYKGGTDAQKRSDITIETKCVPAKEMKKWSDEQKKDALLFLDIADASYQAFRKEIIKLCKQTQ